MIAGVMAISRGPYWQQCLEDLMQYCDKVYVRFDGAHGNPEIVNQLERVCGDKMGKCFITNGWSFPDWREECLRLVGDCKPDIVLCPDQDEMFGEGFADELKVFAASEKKAMLFHYHPLEGHDGRAVAGGRVYPEKPHMKAFKWEKGLSYFPYHGDAKISKYINPECQWNANTKIRHLCCYTPKMEQAKKFRDGKKATKAVTLIGFGPSGKQPMETMGEIWTLNNGYDALNPEAMKLCTRIFEMHPLHKRRGAKDVGRDGKPHLWHLDQEGKKGRRIILLNKSDQITNSETYPLADIEARTGVNTQWHGTPCYMLAMAIVEGFTDIIFYGLDQLDWEHRNQLRAWLFWQGYALGRGIRIGGALTGLERWKKKYGIDYGPEFDEYQEKMLWDGFPFEMRMKMPSRAMAGALYDGDK